MVRAVPDPDHWLTVGVEPTVNVMVQGSAIFAPLRLDQGTNALHFAGAAELVASGYLWKENREQLAWKPFALIEQRGRGFVIGFTADPDLPRRARRAATCCCSTPWCARRRTRTRLTRRVALRCASRSRGRALLGLHLPSIAVGHDPRRGRLAEVRADDAHGAEPKRSRNPRRVRFAVAPSWSKAQSHSGCMHCEG